MLTKKFAIKKVEEFARELNSMGIHLRKVILYGSYARKAQHEYSDIDVALVADEFSGMGFKDIPLFVKVLRKYFIIQPRTFSTDYFRRGDAFIDEIKSTGIEIKF
jgi:predicted nucleotidyltransferase